MDSRKLALDSTAFYSGVPFLASSLFPYYTTKEVLAEVGHIKSSIAGIDALIDSHSLAIAEPDAKSRNIVRQASRRTGDQGKLSTADISIISLALQKHLVLLSDDYSVANVATTLGLDVQSSLGKRLNDVREWSSYCAGCGKGFSSGIIECPLCGNELRRRFRLQRKKK